jgi:rhodanese-related sulfurtransferase
VNIGLDGSYATWAGTLLDHDAPIVLVVEPGRERESAMRLGRIGFDNVAGYLEGGMLALGSSPELVERLQRTTARTLAEQLGEPERPLVVDVRTEAEHEEFAVDASVNIPLARLPERLDELPRDRPIVVHCGSGYRSSIASSLLLLAGFSDVTDLVGGLRRPLGVPSARSA